MKDRKLLVYFGHHKCATVWIHSILSDICGILSDRLEYVHSHRQFGGNIRKFVEENGIDFLTYTNADIEFVSKLNEFKGFHVIRDPRDIAVSSYFSHLNSHPTSNWEGLKRHREKLKKVSKAEGLFLDMDFIHRGVFQRINNWSYSISNILEIKMEVLIKNPFDQFVEIFDFLGIINKQSTSDSIYKISLKTLENFVFQRRFASLSGGRKQGIEDSEHHFRKGISGDWKNHFSEDHKKYFKGKYSDLLIKLDYEKDNNW